MWIDDKRCKEKEERTTDRLLLPLLLQPKTILFAHATMYVRCMSHENIKATRIFKPSQAKPSQIVVDRLHKFVWKKKGRKSWTDDKGVEWNGMEGRRRRKLHRELRVQKCIDFCLPPIHPSLSSFLFTVFSCFSRTKNRLHGDVLPSPPPPPPPPPPWRGE